MTTRHGLVSIQFLDALGVTSSISLNVAVDDSKTIAQALTEATAYAGKADGISDSEITKVTLKIVSPLPSGSKATPASTAENERVGLANFNQVASPYKFGIPLPAVKGAAIVNGKIDLTNTDWQAWVDALILAGTALVVESTGLHTISGLADALLSFRKHRRAETRRSFEVAP